jgi:glycosyltransferase involved in cell wall biosynthesis
MTLYILYDYFLPAYKAGGPIRSLANLSDLLKKDMDINIVCSNKEFGGEILPILPDQWINKDYIRVYYASTGFNKFRKTINNKNRVLFINGLYSLHFNLLPAMLLDGRKIISVRGMLHPGALGQKRLKKKMYLLLWRSLGLHRRCEYHATSAEELQYVQDTFGRNAKIWQVPNMPHILSYYSLPQKKEGTLTIATIALISPMKNYHLVLKSLLDCKTNIDYHIYGPVKDKGYWNKCQEIISAMPSNINVKYHGEIIPEAIDHVLRYCHIFIQPSESENFGHSLYESLTCGRPIITSDFTPWNNLEPNKAGLNVSIEGTSDMTSAIDFFGRMDHDELCKWSVSARQYALDAINITELRKKYLQMFVDGNKLPGA